MTAQPLGETTVTRSWSWGSVVVGDPTAVPPPPTESLVTIGTGALVLRLRHAQDVEVLEGESHLAEATCHVRVLAEPAETIRTTVCDVVLETPSGKLSLGDGAGAVAIEIDGAARHRLVVTADSLRSAGLDEVWIDVVPQPA